MPTPSRRDLLAAAGLAALAAGCGSAPRHAPSPRVPAPAGPPSTGQPPAASPPPAPAVPAVAAPPPLDALPRPSLAEVQRRSGFPVLCYHQLRDTTAADSAATRVFVVPPRDFTAQLAALSAGGYTSITPEQQLRHLATGEPLPPKPVMITLDDASAGQWSVAVPALRRFGFTATFFVMTVVLDKPGWLRRDEVRQLAALGHTVATHTWDHHPVPGYAGNDWRVQIDQPTTELEKLTGRPVRFFAYPYGAWDGAAFPHLRSRGLLAAWQLSDRPLDPVEPLLTLRRRIVAGGLDGKGFRTLLGSPGT